MSDGSTADRSESEREKRLESARSAYEAISAEDRAEYEAETALWETPEVNATADAGPDLNLTQMPLSGVDLENALACIEKGHELTGQRLSAEALARARRVLSGAVTLEQAREELGKKWGERP